MATIQKRGDSYKITVSAGYDAEGKQVRHTMTYKPEAKEGTRKQEKELQKVSLDFEERVKNGEIYSGEKITFNEFFETWLNDYAEKNLKQRIKELYTREIKTHVLPVIGNMKISGVKVAHCQTVINKMHDNGMAVSSIRHIKTAMNQIFKYAVNMEIIENNPVTNVIIPKGKKESKATILTLEQTKELLDCLSWNYPVNYGSRTRKDNSGNVYQVKAYESYKTIPYQFQVYFNLAVFSGCRREELLALTWEDIDIEESTISINKAIVKTKKNGETVEEPKTESSKRVLYMPLECLNMLETWKEKQIQRSFELSNKWEGKPINQFDDQFIFIQETGKRMNIYTPYQRLQSIIEDHNRVIGDQAEKEQDPEKRKDILSRILPKIRLHDLRHCCSSMLIAQGVNVASVSKRLGHSQISTTLNVYTHALPEKDKEASKMLETMFFETENKPVAKMETMRVSRDEKEFLERLRKADPELQELITDMLTGNYSKAELYSMARSGKQKRN